VAGDAGTHHGQSINDSAIALRWIASAQTLRDIVGGPAGDPVHRPQA